MVCHRTNKAKQNIPAKIIPDDFDTLEEYNEIKADWTLTTVKAAVHQYRAQRGNLFILSQALLSASGVGSAVADADNEDESYCVASTSWTTIDRGMAKMRLCNGWRNDLEGSMGEELRT